MKKYSELVAAVVLLAIPTSVQPAQAAEGRQAEPGRTYQVADNIHVAVLENRNTMILVGDDGVMIVESNFTRNAQALKDLIAGITPKPVTLVVNTHWHGDHVGGNALFVEGGAVTLAHENTRTRMSVQQINPVTGGVQLEPHGPKFLPMLTFQDKMKVHFGGEEIDLIHYPEGHTDSDVALFYRDSNVVFLGGLLEYPTYAGVRSPEHFIAALDAVLAEVDENTKLIPWQGPMLGIPEVRQWRHIIATMSARVGALIAEGKTVEEIVAAKPSLEFDAEWGGGRSPDRFAQDMHYALTHPPE